MTLFRQKLVALAALSLCVLFAPIRTLALIPHSASLASSQSALHQSSPVAVLTSSEATVSGMCRNDPVNNFDPLGLDWRWEFTGKCATVLNLEIQAKEGLARGEWKRPVYDWVWHPESQLPGLDRLLQELSPRGPYDSGGLMCFQAGFREGLAKWMKETGGSFEALGDPLALARDLAAALRANPLEVAVQLGLGDMLTLVGDVSTVADAKNAREGVRCAGFTAGHNSPQAASAVAGAWAAKRAMALMRRGGGAGDVALGLWKHQVSDQGGLLERFAERIGAKTYVDFFDRRIYPTPERLEQMLYSADRLHVNLDGLVSSIDDLPDIVNRGSRGLAFRPPTGGGNITNWEIWRIHQDPELLSRTLFYLGGKAVRP